MAKLYSENTTIVWNGNLVSGGSAKVTEFFNSLPGTEHKLSSLDCQPVSGNENEVRNSKKKLRQICVHCTSFCCCVHQKKITRVHFYV